MMQAEELINQLKELTHNNIKEVQLFQKLSDEELNYKIDSESWNILE